MAMHVLHVETGPDNVLTRLNLCKYLQASDPAVVEESSVPGEGSSCSSFLASKDALHT